MRLPSLAALGSDDRLSAGWRSSPSPGHRFDSGFPFQSTSTLVRGRTHRPLFVVRPAWISTCRSETRGEEVAMTRVKRKGATVRECLEEAWSELARVLALGILPGT